MSDIWHRVATALNAEVDAALWQLRESVTFKAMGSEIERAFAAHFVMVMRIGDSRHYIGEDAVVTKHGFFLHPQFEVGKYRVDFVFGRTTDLSARHCIAIECDGHEWHEKTKEQAAKDKARDRFLATEFGAVLHFTGSEIFKDTAGCWLDVLKVMASLHGEGGK